MIPYYEGRDYLRRRAPELFDAIDDAKAALAEGKVHAVHLRAIEDAAYDHEKTGEQGRQRYLDTQPDGSTGRHRDSMG